jgi:hypothetical protein
MAMSRWQNPTYAMNDYQLNLEKVLEKKLIAAKRVKSLNYEYTGGGIVAEADVATYELLKTAAVYFYQHYSDKDGKAEITNVTDKTRKNIIQVTIRVSDRQSQLGGYTINFYHTTSKMLVRDRPFNLKGGAMVFCFVQKNFYEHKIFFVAQSANFFSRI